jgi:hypothetical protein
VHRQKTYKVKSKKQKFVELKVEREVKQTELNEQPKVRLVDSKSRLIDALNDTLIDFCWFTQL